MSSNQGIKDKQLPELACSWHPSLPPVLVLLLYLSCYASRQGLCVDSIARPCECTVLVSRVFGILPIYLSTLHVQRTYIHVDWAQIPVYKRENITEDTRHGRKRMLRTLRISANVLVMGWSQLCPNRVRPNGSFGSVLVPKAQCASNGSSLQNPFLPSSTKERWRGEKAGCKDLQSYIPLGCCFCLYVLQRMAIKNAVCLLTLDPSYPIPSYPPHPSYILFVHAVHPTCNWGDLFEFSLSPLSLLFGSLLFLSHSSLFILGSWDVFVLWDWSRPGNARYVLPAQ